ncbi:hypothetical protein VQ03_23490 [Methylobacterium tarhaniae]|uniref:GIY-YIG domain-containing protein n=1 Tax=Methylobacterium tarhaniae TaxID=1187852 RepID=A0A0J6V620_9HYPH|nr:hypothetical protein [Methylobacterium tarhaniae]KMO34361.1 hypothetical protein VQ03_23490 [Methylobacterium tarhaniae]
MTDLTILHRRPRQTCRCGCTACASEAAGQDIELLARESLSAALMHAQDDLALEAAGPGATPRRLPGPSRVPRFRPPARRFRVGPKSAGLKSGFIPPMHSAPMRLSKSVPVREVLDGKHDDYNQPVTGEGRIYVLSLPGVDRPLYVGEIRADSKKQTLASRLLQHFGGKKQREFGGQRQDCFSVKNFKESCILREALQGRFDQLRRVLTKAGLNQRQQDHVERHIKSGNIRVRYATYRLPPGIDRNDLNARIQLQHAAELSAKNHLRALIRSNSLSFEEEEEEAERRRTGVIEYRVV